MFNWAVGQGYVESNPFANKLASPKIKKARIGRFDEEEMQLILGAELERQEPDRKWLVLIADKAPYHMENGTLGKWNT